MVGTFLPSLISMTLSVGMRISPKFLFRPMDSILRSRVVRTLFSCPEYVFTTYQILEHEVHGGDVDGQHEDDDEHHGRALPELVAVGPGDSPQLTAHVPGELPGTGQKTATLTLRLLLL